MSRPVVRALVLVLLGAAALVLSFVLSPTPDTFMVLSNGHRVRTPADMHAVDYAILLLRVGGAVAVLAGAHVAYRAWQPDRVQDGEGVPHHPRGKDADVGVDAGVHVFPGRRP
jgi:hypothetical protein